MNGVRNSMCSKKSSNGCLVTAGTPSRLPSSIMPTCQALVFLPSKSTMAPGGGVAPSVGEVRSTFFSSNFTPSSAVPVEESVLDRAVEVLALEMRDAVLRVAVQTDLRLSVPAGSRKAFRIDHGVEPAAAKRDHLGTDFRLGSDRPHVLALHGEVGAGLLGIQECSAPSANVGITMRANKPAKDRSKRSKRSMAGLLEVCLSWRELVDCYQG